MADLTVARAHSRLREPVPARNGRFDVTPPRLEMADLRREWDQTSLREPLTARNGRFDRRTGPHEPPGALARREFAYLGVRTGPREPLEALGRSKIAKRRANGVDGAGGSPRTVQNRRFDVRTGARKPADGLRRLEMAALTCERAHTNLRDPLDGPKLSISRANAPGGVTGSSRRRPKVRDLTCEGADASRWTAFDGTKCSIYRTNGPTRVAGKPRTA